VNYHRQVLSEDERVRASRFHFERHRRRYIVSQGIVRKILGSYLDVEPAELIYELGDHGKPALAGGLKKADLHFNLTHSHEIALFAMLREVEVGIDVEFFRPMDDFDSVAGRFFSSAEQSAYFSLSEELRPQGFYNCWTRKEAFIKAIGDGLSYPLEKFDVSLVPGEPAQLFRIENEPQEASHWTLEAFYPLKEYTAAVALRAKDIRFQWFWYGE
jgi:4'-phosphopantetheinyl transferase